MFMNVQLHPISNIENYYFLTNFYFFNFLFLFYFYYLKIYFFSPADYSHVCKVPANYDGDHDIQGSGTSCDNYMVMMSAATGAPGGGGAWPLNGVSVIKKATKKKDQKMTF